MRVFGNLEEFRAAVGEDLGASDWHTVTQEQIDKFADATGDHQWIHVDPARAADGPFGGTIAHGFLTLSLVPVLSTQLYRIENLAMGVNYGVDRVRFPTPVPVGSRVRVQGTLAEVTETGAGTQAKIRFVVEIEGAAKPACIVDQIFVLVGA